ncbi:MAG: endonuclease, partial [Muribaculaceae bacterium]|nr:endonuclease [Muribaculaceae bacterium]
DMYSTKHWSFSSKCGNYSSVGDCYNREHSLPKSWFKEASPMKSDAFHVYPTDGKVNGQRSNYPYGECSGGTTLSAPSGIKALGRLGTSTFSGYSGKVFEPDDEYKGDLARTYFYMAAAYNDKIKGWNSDMLAQNSYPVFNSWAINLLLKWHRQDPVSQKEIERNEAVYAHQNNRNPFIDHPELAEHIWGDKSTTAWSGSDQSEPVISLPVNNSTIDFGTTATGYSVSRSISIKTINLTEPISLSVSNGSFTLSTSSVTARNANAGTSVSVTGKATTAGTTTATLTLKSGDLKTTVTLSLKALDGLPALEATNVTGESFTARWVDLGIDNTLSLQVMKDGTCIDGYPVTVNSALEEYDVDNLEPLTTYTYRLLSSTLTSNTVIVTTAELLPSAQVIYDGDIILSASPGVASDPVELYLDIEHIEGNITLSVPKPFQLSVN